ncbi:hypothetical protein ACFXAE_34380 [Streptomyces sp. NPDC059454]|uniref:hypothetical protein n=1 Tax=Streptomyces sp. NPDC059454 TaxID=3346836 RepID=UPI0036A62990
MGFADAAAPGPGLPPERARAPAAAVVILDAVGAGAYRGHALDTTGLPRETVAVPRALRRPGVIRGVRAPAVAPGDTVTVTE